MTRLVVFAGLVTIAVAACAKRDSFDVRVDAAFTAEEQREIVAALREWEDKTSATNLLGVHFASIEIVEQQTDGDLFLTPNCPVRMPANTVGFTHQLGIHSFVECFQMPWFHSHYPDYFPRAVLHETGHALGLAHYEGKSPSVMHPDIGDDAEHLQCVDVAQFCDVSGDCLLTYGDCE